jgi:hypothetical protein
VKTTFIDTVHGQSAMSFATKPKFMPIVADFDERKTLTSRYVRLQHLLLLLFALLFFGSLTSPLRAQTPIPLPTGNWVVIANGYTGRLYISGVDAAGNIQAGSTFFGNPIAGFFDATSAHINFIRVGVDIGAEQIYDGYLFRSVTNPSAYFLTGEFLAYRETLGSAKRFQLGWYAQLGAAL